MIDELHLLKLHIPFAVDYISIRLNADKTVYFFVWHHHVRLTRVVTVGVWDPDVLDITSFYGESAVEFSSETGVSPSLAEVCVDFIFLFTK